MYPFLHSLPPALNPKPTLDLKPPILISLQEGPLEGKSGTYFRYIYLPPVDPPWGRSWKNRLENMFGVSNVTHVLAPYQCCCEALKIWWHER